jgi:hypothetical protein
MASVQTYRTILIYRLKRSNARASAAKARASSLYSFGLTRLRRLQAPGRPSTPGDRVEGLWRDVGAVRPDDRATVYEVAREEFGGLENLEHRAIEPLAEVDRILGAVVEDHTHAEATLVFRLYNARKECHGVFSDSGAMLSSGCPAFIFAQFASSSERCS